MSAEPQHYSEHLALAFSIVWAAIIYSAPVSGATPAPSSNLDPQAHPTDVTAARSSTTLLNLKFTVRARRRLR